MRKVLAAAILVVGGAVGGYLIGESATPTIGEANQAQTVAEKGAKNRAALASFPTAKAKGVSRGLAVGRREAQAKAGVAGEEAGTKGADAELAAIAEAEAAAAAAEAERQLEYSDELPHGEPGYLLPEDERTLGCVGYDAVTGQCVGD